MSVQKLFSVNEIKNPLIDIYPRNITAKEVTTTDIKTDTLEATSIVTENLQLTSGIPSLSDVLVSDSKGNVSIQNITFSTTVNTTSDPFADRQPVSIMANKVGKMVTWSFGNVLANQTTPNYIEIFLPASGPGSPPDDFIPSNFYLYSPNYYFITSYASVVDTGSAMAPYPPGIMYFEPYFISPDQGWYIYIYTSPTSNGYFTGSGQGGITPFTFTYVTDS